MTGSPRALQDLLREPLLRLLAINLAIGATVAVLMLCGLLALNPQGLRDLIVADCSPLVVLGLLLLGLVATFGGVAMGSAVMAIGNEDSGSGATRSVESGAVEAQISLLTARHRNDDHAQPHHRSGAG